MRAVLDRAPNGGLIRKVGIMGVVLNGGIVRPATLSWSTSHPSPTAVWNVSRPDYSPERRRAAAILPASEEALRLGRVVSCGLPLEQLE